MGRQVLFVLILSKKSFRSRKRKRTRLTFAVVSILMKSFPLGEKNLCTSCTERMVLLVSDVFLRKISLRSPKVIAIQIIVACLKDFFIISYFLSFFQYYLPIPEHISLISDIPNTLFVRRPFQVVLSLAPIRLASGPKPVARAR